MTSAPLTVAQLKTLADAMAEDQSDRLSATIQWRIQNLSAWDPQIHGRKIVTPQFKLINLTGSDCTLSVDLQDVKSDSCLKVGFQSDRFPVSCPMEFEWTLLDGNELPILKKVVKLQTLSRELIVEMPDTPTYADIFERNRSTYLSKGTLTVQLRILITNWDFEKAKLVSVVSRVEVVEEYFVWCIERFGTLQLKEENVTWVQLGEDVFKLISTLKGTLLKDAEVNFCIVADKKLHQYIKVKLSLLDREEKEAMTVVKELQFSSDKHDQIWNKTNFFRREILEKGSDLLQGEHLVLRCKFSSGRKTHMHKYNHVEYCRHENLETNITRDRNATNKISQQIQRTVSPEDNAQPSKIETYPDTAKHSSVPSTIVGDDFLSIYKEQIWSDFELRSGDVTYPVHKVVLGARSSVFKEKFRDDKEETGSKSMVIDDLDTPTLGRMLTFMYADKVDNLQWEDTLKLYSAANKYKVESLKQECSNVLRSNTTVSNVSEILEPADRHQDQELISHVLNFIEEHFNEVIASDEWDKFLEKSCLGGRTMKKVLKNFSFKKT